MRWVVQTATVNHGSSWIYIPAKCAGVLSKFTFTLYDIDNPERILGNSCAMLSSFQLVPFDFDWTLDWNGHLCLFDPAKVVAGHLEMPSFSRQISISLLLLWISPCDWHHDELNMDTRIKMDVLRSNDLPNYPLLSRCQKITLVQNSDYTQPWITQGRRSYTQKMFTTQGHAIHFWKMLVHLRVDSDRVYLLNPSTGLLLNHRMNNDSTHQPTYYFMATRRWTSKQLGFMDVHPPIKSRLQVLIHSLMIGFITWMFCMHLLSLGLLLLDVLHAHIACPKKNIC